MDERPALHGRRPDAVQPYNHQGTGRPGIGMPHALDLSLDGAMSHPETQSPGTAATAHFAQNVSRQSTMFELTIQSPISDPLAASLIDSYPTPGATHPSENMRS